MQSPFKNTGTVYQIMRCRNQLFQFLERIYSLIRIIQDKSGEKLGSGHIHLIWFPHRIISYHLVLVVHVSLAVPSEACRSVDVSQSQPTLV